MTPTRRNPGKSARTTAPTPPTPSAELDAALAIVEARAPGLRRAGVARLVLGELDLYLAPPAEVAPAKGKPDEDEDADGSLLDLSEYRGEPRKTRTPGGMS